jgi:hypothetical protein
VLLVVGDLAGEEVELAVVGLSQRVAVHDVVGVAVHVHGAVDAEQLVRRRGQRQQVVGHRDHRAVEPSQQRVEGLLRRQVEADRRLVEHQQPRARAQRLGQHHAPLLAAGEPAHGAIGAVQQLHAGQRLVRRLAVGPAQAAERPQAPAAAPAQPPERHHVAHGRRKARGDGVSLRHVAHLARGGAGRAPQHLDAPARHRHEAEQRAQERRLAGAVGPHHADEPAGAHLEAQVLEHQPALTLDADVLAAHDHRRVVRGGAHGAAPSARANAAAFQRRSAS